MALSYAISPDTGTSTSDRYTKGDASHRLVLSGTGTKSDTVTVSYLNPATGGMATLQTTVGAGGKWSLTTPTLSDGVYQFTVTELNSKGAVVAQLPASAAWTIDTQTNVSFSGTSSTASASGVLLTGTAEAFDTVNITYRNANGKTVSVGTTTADAFGQWSLTKALSAGSYSFTATATDKAGNTALATQSVTVLGAPTEAVSSILVAGDNVVNQAEAAQATMPVRITLTAPLASGDRVVVTYAAQSYVAVRDTSDASGKTYVAAVTTATTGGTVSARVENSLGTPGTTVSQAFTVDTVPPAAPTLTVRNDGGTGVALSNDNTLHLAGTAEPGSVVTVTWINQAGVSSVLGSATAAADGTWSLDTPALADGGHAFSATARDAAGNLGPASGVASVTVDTLPPAAPTLAVRDDGGIGVALSNDNTLHLAGTAEAGSTVTVTWTNQAGVSSVLGSATAAADGTWSLDTPALADGGHAFSATARDAAGNLGPASGIASVTVDTVPPSAVATSIVVAGDNIVDGAEAQQATVPIVIKVSQPVAAGETVIVTSGAASYVATQDASDPTGLTYTAAIATPQGAGSLAARVQDAAGNASAPLTQAYTYQSAAPAPHWDHIVVVIEENHTYSQIIGSGSAPYINSLASQGALFTNFNAATNPSQPNYLILFSGSAQGVVDDNFHFFDAPTVAGQVQAAGGSFAGYFETGSGQRHLPWLSFAESHDLGLNFSGFPTDFSQLPTLSFVIPNDANNMHDGTVSTGDSWLQANLGQYAAWAQSHNSLLIVTFDEGSSGSNRIPTIVVGAGIAPQQISSPMDHYGLLHTIESALGLSALGDSAGTPVMTFSGLAALNNAPVGRNDTYYAVTSTPLTVGTNTGVLANDSDRDGDSLSALLVGGPSHGTLQLNSDGSFTYAPVTGYVGPDSFTYRATDGKNAGAVATASLYVSPTAPVQMTFQQGVAGYTGVIDTMLRASAPNTNLGSATSLSVDSSNPTGTGLADEVLLQFTNLFGSGPNQIPLGSTIVSATLTVQTTVAGNGADLHRMLTGWTGGATWNSLVNGIQADGSEAMTSIDAHVGPVTATGATTIDVSTALQAWANGAPNYGWAFTPIGDDEWRISSSETSGGPRLSVVFVAPVGNQAPLAAADSFSTAQGTPLSVSAAAGVLTNDRDFDGNPLTARLVNGPSHGALQFNADGSFTYSPDAAFGGLDSFTYVASDGTADSSPTVVNIGVGKLTQHTLVLQQGVNGYFGTHDTMLRQDAPNANYGTTSGLVIDSDDPGGSYHWSEGLLRFDNLIGDGTNQVPLGAHVISATLNLQTTDTGNGGGLYAMLQAWSENDTWNTLGTGIQANGLEAASQAVATTGFVGSLGATAINVTSSVQAWASGAANYGWAILPVGADGWRFGSAEYTTPPSITVVYESYDPNRAPVGAVDNYSTAKDSVLSVSAAGVLANDQDPEGDSLTAKLVSGPSHGVLQLNADGSFTYTPNAGYAGTDSFAYRASDGQLDSAPVNVSIGVGTLTHYTLTLQQGANGYTGTHDTVLRQDQPTTRSGATTVLNIDADDPGGTHFWKEGLLRFDDLVGTGTNQVPLGAHIVSATLSLQTTDTGSGGEFHAMLQSWSENDSWNSLVNGIQADGTEAAAAVAARTGFVGSLGQTNIDVTSSVQGWVDGAANYGWAILPLGDDGWRFGSAEYTTPPSLTIAFDVYI